MGLFDLLYKESG